MKAAVKHIIFDLGGVILNIDYQKPIQAFADLGIHTLYSKAAQSTLFDELETGRISGDDFLNNLVKMAQKGTTPQQIKQAWNSIILDFPIRRLQLLQQLQLHYDLYLLSNTNEIHEEAFNQILFSTCGYPNLAMFFDKVYLSHRVGLRKPDPAIFQLVLEQNQIKPEETLFLDDSPQHIETASKLGIQTIHVTEDRGMLDIFLPKQ
ncbi:MAG: HAD family phosphatase [Chitinophagaceae bacterium]|nr:HAD family phosphatase [Chitinophagaceae bacterium]